MTTWLVGDVHGCARELARLIERLGPGRDDRIVLLGDLFHRGPDPFGVLELVQEHGLEFLLGNHEVALFQRLGWGVDDPHGLEVPEGLDAARVAGDGGRELRLAATRRAELVRFVVREHAGLFVEGDELPGGLRWCAVHAGLYGASVADGGPGLAGARGRGALALVVRAARGAGVRGLRSPRRATGTTGDPRGADRGDGDRHGLPVRGLVDGLRPVGEPGGGGGGGRELRATKLRAGPHSRIFPYRECSTRGAKSGSRRSSSRSSEVRPKSSSASDAWRSLPSRT
jgi:hypothetical protein